MDESAAKLIVQGMLPLGASCSPGLYDGKIWLNGYFDPTEIEALGVWFKSHNELPLAALKFSDFRKI